jgi:hypothetical protein
MSLLSPWFLAGALAVGLPLWLHLLQRQNPVKLPFSSLMFMEKRQQSSLKERKLRYLLLLASRLALLILLALAFSKPVWDQPPAAVLGRIATLHLVVIDTSLSMNYGDRWQRAVAEAEGIIDGMQGGDRAQIISNGPGVQVLTSISADQTELKNAIATLKPSSSRNSFGEVAEAVRSLAAERELPVEVHLISDFQQTAMPGRFSDLTLPTDALMTPHNIADPNAANWAVESVKGATRLFGARKPRLEATIAGFAPAETEKRVSLLLNGQRVATQAVKVPAGGRAIAKFDGFDAPKGHSRVEVVLEPADELPIDDKRLLTIDNSDPEPILFVTADRRERDVLYYRAALDASSEAVFGVESVSPGEADRIVPDRYALIVLSDIAPLPSTFGSRLEKYVQSGGSVFIAVGPKTAAEGKAPLSSLRIELPRATGGSTTRFQLAGEVEASHPALGHVERLRGVKFFRHALLWTTENDEVLMRLSDGSPLLVEQKLGDGRLILFASSLDNVWNDLPVHPVFVPFVAETATYLSDMEEGSAQAVVDSVLELRRRRTAATAVQAFDPQGERALSLTESLTEQMLPLTQLGFYELRRPGLTELVAVNPDARESNLRPMETDTLALWKATGREHEDIREAMASESALKPPPLRIWRLILVLLVLALLIESILGNWHLKVQREV